MKQYKMTDNLTIPPPNSVCVCHILMIILKFINCSHFSNRLTQLKTSKTKSAAWRWLQDKGW